MNHDQMRELVERALDDTDETAASDAFRALQRAQPPVQLFELCQSLLQDSEPERDLATGLLIAFSYADSRYRTQALVLLHGVLEAEYSSSVLSGATLALAHFGETDSVRRIIPFHAHDDEELRLNVAKSIARLANEAKWESQPQLREELVYAMIELLEDFDQSVRDWATFAFSNELSEDDSPAIRSALYNRLRDSDELVRDQAILALVHRRDEIVIPVIETLLVGAM